MGWIVYFGLTAAGLAVVLRFTERLTAILGTCLLGLCVTALALPGTRGPQGGATELFYLLFAVFAAFLSVLVLGGAAGVVRLFARAVRGSGRPLTGVVMTGENVAREEDADD